MTKVTKADLEKKVASIVRLTGQPLTLTAWSPGDGYTRYQLQNADQQPISHYNRLHEMAEYLNGMLAMYDIISRSPNWNYDIAN